MDRESIHDALQQGEVHFVFEKADGTMRELTAIPYSNVPSEHLPKGGDPKPASADNILKVYEKGVGWRTIRVDKIKSVNPLTSQ